VKYVDQAVALTMTFGPKLLLALFTLLFGLWFIRLAMHGVDKAMDQAGIETTLQKFLLSLINVGLKSLLLVSVITMIGVETTSIIAMLGAAGLAVGLALQGSLANFAGGVLILFFKPFKVDYRESSINANGAGTVNSGKDLGGNLCNGSTTCP
jgi:small conductance mechanosensitive channel